MARTPLIFQVQITTTGVAKPMKWSYGTEAKAREEIAPKVAFSKTERGQESWGDVTGVVIFNKETGETITVI